jgi:hypothetical protein
MILYEIDDKSFRWFVSNRHAGAGAGYFIRARRGWAASDTLGEGEVATLEDSMAGRVLGRGIMMDGPACVGTRG